VQRQHTERQQRQHRLPPPPALAPGRAGHQGERHGQDGGEIGQAQREHRAAVPDAGRHTATPGHLTAPDHVPDAARHVLAELADVVPVQRVARRRVGAERRQAPPPAEADDEEAGGADQQGEQQQARIGVGDRVPHVVPAADQLAPDEEDAEDGDRQPDRPDDATFHRKIDVVSRVAAWAAFGSRPVRRTRWLNQFQ
jgi:hypothetical protein